MKRIILTVVLICLGSFLFYSCGENDSALNNEDTAILARGYVMLNPDLESQIHFFGISPSISYVDSVILADSLMYLSAERPSVDFYGTYQRASYYNSSDTNRFVSGDMLPITFYTPYGNSFCETIVLDQDVDSLLFVSGSIPVTIPQYGNFTVHWHPVDKADWYLIEFHHYGPGGPHASEFAVDTFFMFDSTNTGSTVRFSVQPVCGPLPTDTKGNITGGVVIGSVYGTTYGDYASVSIQTSAETVEESPEVIKVKDPFEALDELLDRYQK